MSIKRLNYFFGQFLKEKDFQDEQGYHIEALSMHNKNLHSWGIASGLDVHFTRGKKHVIVEEGMAIDEAGKQIILQDKRNIDLSTATSTIIYLTISHKNTECDPTEENGAKNFTRITEEPLIELGNTMPAEPSKNLFLAKITLNPDKTGISLEKKDRKKIGISGDFEVNSLSFILPIDQDRWPTIRGTDGSNPLLEIESENTVITGNLHVAGTLSGNLHANMVSTDHIEDKSISLSKIKTRNVVSVNGTISKNSDKKVAEEPSDSHRFFMTSVIPTSPGLLEWRWQTEFKKNKLSYILMLTNTSEKDVDYEIKYYDLSDK